MDINNKKHQITNCKYRNLRLVHQGVPGTKIGFPLPNLIKTRDIDSLFEYLFQNIGLVELIQVSFSTSLLSLSSTKTDLFALWDLIKRLHF